MEIIGSWWRCDDGIVRPILDLKVQGAQGTLQLERFLVDSGADRTVFGADLLARLQLPTLAGAGLQGISGPSACVLIHTALELPRADGGSARVNGQFAAFTERAATDLSILGRDVLDHFDLILSRPRDAVLLLAGNHGYTVQGP